MTVHETPVGATVEWYTPPALFDTLGLTFDLDPASPSMTPKRDRLPIGSRFAASGPVSRTNDRDTHWIVAPEVTGSSPVGHPNSPHEWQDRYGPVMPIADPYRLPIGSHG